MNAPSHAPPTPSPPGRLPVAVLGATGTVGARLVRRLADHPWFRLAEVAASERSAHHRLADRAPADAGLDAAAAELVLQRPDGPFRSHLVLSALPAEAARSIEPELAGRGHLVVSNASAFRDDPGVPLLIPELNPDHLDLLDAQVGRWKAAGGRSVRGGGIVTNPNCAVAGLMPALAPLHERFGVRRVLVTTLQAVSGAGRPGPSAIDLVDNVIPSIPGEEAKLATEPAKILGRIAGGRIEPATVVVSATTTRVPVIHGHLESVSVELESHADPDMARAAWTEFRIPPVAEGLPSSPARLVHLFDDDDRPQPRLDRELSGGMAVAIGRVRACPVLTLRFIVLSHNLERGAAGAALLNAELARARGRVRDALRESE